MSPLIYVAMETCVDTRVAMVVDTRVALETPVATDTLLFVFRFSAWPVSHSYWTPYLHYYVCITLVLSLLLRFR